MIPIELMDAFSRLQQVVQTTIRNPTGNLAVTTLLAAAVVLALFIVVMLLLLLATPKRRKVVKVRRRVVKVATAAAAGTDVAVAAADEAATVHAEPELTAGPPEPVLDATDPPAEPSPAPIRKRSFKVPAALGAMTIPALVILALTSGYVVTGTDAYCGTCHAGTKVAHDKTRTQKVGCAKCHESGGLGMPGDVIRRGRMLVKSTVGAKGPTTAVVNSENCLDCHKRDIEGVTKGATVRMSHTEPLAAGWACNRCHTGAGHDKAAPVSMSTCLRCHNDEKASAKCSTCHSSDPYDGFKPETNSLTLSTRRLMYPLVTVDRKNCDGCHDQEKQCDSCHGIRMPHSPQFIANGHAKEAAFEKKRTCTKCHTIESCNSGCHTGFPGGHGDNWKVEHAKMPRDSGCGCHQSRSGRTVPMCTLCH